MASKKYSLLAGVLSLFAFSALQAQDTYRGAGYDVSDTSLIPTSRIEQQRDFLSKNYDFPAKPRNQWEIGASLGLFNVSGDVRSKMPWNTVRGKDGNGSHGMFNAMGYSLQVRKAWGYIVSTRLQYLHGGATGYNWQQSSGYTDHNNGNPWVANYQTSSPYTYDFVNYNYKTNIDELSLQMLVSLNNIKFHKARNKMGVYGLVGIGGMLYDTWVNALGTTGAPYTALFNTISDTMKAIDNNGFATGSQYKDVRPLVNDLLKAGLDDTYESRAERHENRPYFGNDRTYRTILTAGLGASFRLGKRLSLNIEDKWSYTNDDLVDGQRWQEYPQPGNGGSAMTRDFDTYNYASVGLGVNLGGKSVDPLWWMNPLDYQYNSIAKGPKGSGTSKCDIDSDGDGVSDCFDRCPDTPAGVAVDTKGCCLDTDGDGVCDYKDKQLITPTECQPVDADGVGNCPCDPKCGTIKPDNCGDIPTGSIMFAPGSTKLDGSGMSQLSSLASKLKASPQCKVILEGNGNANKVEQQRSWARTNACINYLVNNQGIDRDRIIFRYGGGNGNSSVSYMSAGMNEMGGNTPPPPFPNLK